MEQIKNQVISDLAKMQNGQFSRTDKINNQSTGIDENVLNIGNISHSGVVVLDGVVLFES